MVVLFVILTFAIFILADAFVRRVIIRGEAREAARASKVRKMLARVKKEFVMPLGYFFHPGHTWAKIEDSGEVSIGVDDFASKLIGKIDSVELPEVGCELRQGYAAFKIKQGVRVAEFVSPVSGEVVEVNRDVNASEIVKDPYYRGWLVRVRPSDLKSDLAGLEIAKDAVQWMRSEIKQLIELLWGQVSQPVELGQTAQDGGLPIQGVLEKMDDATWRRFSKQFLKA